MNRICRPRESETKKDCVVIRWVPSVGMAYATSDPYAQTGRKLITAPSFKPGVSWEKAPGT